MTCFDVTFKGYNEVWSGEHDETLPEHAFGKADELVKWVVAPDRTALDMWIERNGLREHLDGDPTPMQGRRPSGECYGHDDGVDLILDDQGNVVSMSPHNEGDWRKNWLALKDEVAGLLAEVA